MGDRIYVADSQESVFFMKYKKAENQLYIYADDTTSRYLTTQLQLDYDTLCGADKFGNIFMMRLPAELSQQVSGWQVLHMSLAMGCALDKRVHSVAPLAVALLLPCCCLASFRLNGSCVIIPRALAHCLL